MNLQQLEYIVALDKYKNFSKAAESCFITQATLSTMVKKFEEELNLVIFDRKTTPVMTTSCGEPIIEQAKKVIEITSNIKYFADQTRKEIEGHLNIGIIPTIASNLLHRLIPVFIAKYPKLKLNIQEITTSNIINQLKNGRLDVGILSTPLSSNENLEEDILYYEKLMVYGKIEMAEQTFLSPKDLINENIWLLEQGNCISDQIVNVCQLSKKKMNKNINFHPNSFDSLLNLVDSFDGLTVIPELFVLDLPKKRKSLVRDFVSPFPVREISMVSYRPYVKKRLIDVLSEEIKTVIKPILQTSQLKNKDLMIAKM